MQVIKLTKAEKTIFGMLREIGPQDTLYAQFKTECGIICDFAYPSLKIGIDIYSPPWLKKTDVFAKVPPDWTVKSIQSDRVASDPDKVKEELKRLLSA